MLGGAGIPLGLRGRTSNAITLPPGTTYIIPAGNYVLGLGAYTSLQFLDPVTNIWRTAADADVGNPTSIMADGANQRLANLTGCAVGALITTAAMTGCTTGIGTTAVGCTVTSSTGAAVWQPVVGGAISATPVTGVTGSTVGAGYLYNPAAIISAPPPGGLQATAHVTGIPTTGALLAAQLIIDNQGAGYPVKSTGISTATVTFVNDPRDTAGAGATVQLGATGTGLLTGLYPSNNGVPGTVVPTLAFSVGGAAATAIMNFVVTAYTSGTTGITYLTGSVPLLTTTSNIVAGTPVFTNPLYDKGVTFPRPARIQTVLSGNAITTTGQVIEDAGFGIQGVPTPAIIGVQVTAVLTGATPLVMTVGGIVDTSFIQPI